MIYVNLVDLKSNIHDLLDSKYWNKDVPIFHDKEVYQKQYSDMKYIVEKKSDISFNQMEVNKFMMKSESVKWQSCLNVF